MTIYPSSPAPSCPWLRKRWNRDDLHVLGVMLPGYGENRGPADPDSWAWFRETQGRGLAIPHAALVNTIDLGDEKNIHPADKAPITDRLARESIPEPPESSKPTQNHP